LLRTRGDLGAETLRSDGLPVVRMRPHPRFDVPQRERKQPRPADEAGAA
jgi:hypothetical protein